MDLSARLLEALEEVSDPDSVPGKARFFQAGPGGYAEGDEFLGVTVPQVRAIARRYRAETTAADLAWLLDSRWHEARLLAAVLAGDRYARADTAGRRELVDLVLRRAESLDNWDLVDTCAARTLGAWLVEHPQDVHLLDEQATAASRWRRRLAMVATQALIREGRYQQTLRIAVQLIDDPEPLVQKGIGWMLREISGRDRAVLDAFLDEYAARLSRVALRAAIERHPPAERAQWRARRPG